MFDLYLVTDPSARLGVVEATRRAVGAVQPGRLGILVRDPSLAPPAIADLASRLIDVARAHGATVLVSHDAEVAASVGADGVHLRESSVTPEAARDALPQGALVGASRHDRDGVLVAAHDRVDLLTVGPFGAVPDKAPALGPAGLRTVIAGVRVPAFALGGIGVAEVASAIAAGAHGVAVRRAVYSAEDPAAIVSRLLEAIDEARAHLALDGTRSVR